MHAWVAGLLESQVLREGLQLLEGEPFRSIKLKDSPDRVRNACESVRKLERLLMRSMSGIRIGFTVPR